MSSSPPGWGVCGVCGGCVGGEGGRGALESRSALGRELPVGRRPEPNMQRPDESIQRPR